MKKAKARPEWARIPRADALVMPPAAVEAIARRRRQMLVHSCLYYVLDSPLVSDDQWQHWANQLVRLQRKFGREIGFYDEAFQDWNASSGYYLPMDPHVVRVARRLLDQRDGDGRQND